MSESGEPGGRGRCRWPRADVAERLLKGEDVVDADARTAELARLLAAARSQPPGRPGDECAALDAFRRGVADPPADGVPSPAAGGGEWRAPRRFRSVRTLSGAAAALIALSGVAIAGQSGALSHPFHSSGGGPDRVRPSATATVSPSAPAGHASVPRSPGEAPTASPASPPSARPGSPAASAGPPPQPSALPSPGTADPGVRGACETYVQAARQGRQLDAATLAGLTAAAGGPDKVDAYCAGLTGTRTTGPVKKTAPRPTLPATPAVTVAPGLVPHT